MKTEIMEVCNQEIKKKEGKNKGFSLVELIVVIAIMAILAIVVAPQIMKYIGQSRTSVDQSNMSLCETAAKTALANEKAYAEVVKTNKVTIKVESTGISYTTDPASASLTDFKADFEEILTNIPAPKTGSYFEVTIPVTTGKIGKIFVEVK